MRNLIAVSVAAILCVTTTAVAITPPEQWAEVLTRIEALLVEGRYGKAERKAARLEEDMLTLIVGGPRVAGLLGRIAALYAIALAGTGDSRHAAWKWHMAKAFHPDVTEIDLGRYGPAGATLQVLLAEPDPATLHSGTELTSYDWPRFIRGPDPVFPPAQRDAGARCTITVETVIGTDGVLTQPKIVDSQGRPVLAYTALNALRRWKFEPAMTPNGPIPVHYSLKVGFGD